MSTPFARLLVGLLLPAVVFGACKPKPQLSPAGSSHSTATPAAPPKLSPDRFGDLPPPEPASSRPRRIGAPGGASDAADTGTVGPMAVDVNGDVYVLDGDAGEVVLQPWGPHSDARLLTRVPPLGGGQREELFGIAIDASNV